MTGCESQGSAGSPTPVFVSGGGVMAITPTKALLPGVGVAYSGGRADYVVPLVDDGAGNLVPQGGGSAGGGAGPLTDRSGAIGEGGTAQEVAPANADRRYLLIVNTSVEWLYVEFGTPADAGVAVPLAPAATAGQGGGVLVFEGSFVPAQSVSILGGTTGSTFVAKEG